MGTQKNQSIKRNGQKPNGKASYQSAASNTQKPKQFASSKPQRNGDRQQGAAQQSKRKLFDQGNDADDNDSSVSEDEVDGGAALELRPHKRAKSESNGKAEAIRTAVRPGEPGLTSRESHAKQKQLAQERKATKPLADELQRSKKLWERLRRKSHVPVDERKKLVAELFEIITGRVKDFVLKHDSVRVVQTALKYANVEQRKQIAKELQGTFVHLAENRYAKFLIGKMLVRNDDEIRDIIIPEFYGKVRKLINHPEASWILDDIYRGVATKHQKAVMLREWYGPQFSMFTPDSKDTPTADLQKILEEEPEKRNLILKHLMDMINQLIQKKMTGFTMLHDAMMQYFLNTKPASEERNEFIEVIKGDESGDLLRNMAFTQSGARLSSLLLAYGSAKDRKQYMKVYKNTFQLMAQDQWGHAVILTAYDVIDDTVLTSKAIFPELLGKAEEQGVDNVLSCANDPHARIAIRYLFEGLNQTLFGSAYHSDKALLEETHEIRKTTSKKDVETRRRELMAALSPTLLSCIATEPAPAQLVSTSFGCQLVTDVLLDAQGEKLEVLQAIANTASPSAPVVPEEARAFRTRMYKTLIQGGRFDAASKSVKKTENSPSGFADLLFAAIKENVLEWATGLDSFVVLALLEADDFEGRAELTKLLQSHLEVVQQAADTPVYVPGQDEATDGKKKKKAAKPVAGNKGAKLILAKLPA